MHQKLCLSLCLSVQRSLHHWHIASELGYTSVTPCTSWPHLLRCCVCWLGHRWPFTPLRQVRRAAWSQGTPQGSTAVSCNKKQRFKGQVCESRQQITCQRDSVLRKSGQSFYGADVLALGQWDAAYLAYIKLMVNDLFSTSKLYWVFDAMISETLCVPSVFLDKEQATSLISRQKRNTPSTLEQACMEKVCSYEEARKFFQDTYRTVSPLLIPSSFPQTSFAPLFVKRKPLCSSRCLLMPCYFFSRISSGQSTLVSALLKGLSITAYALALHYSLLTSPCSDGDQCAEKPCKNGAMCSDSVGGFDCVCKSGFTGALCEKGEKETAGFRTWTSFLICFSSSASFPLCFHNADETLCTLEKDQGCSQFCKPGYISYECSCARGWKLNTDKKQCVPQGTSVMYWNYFFLHVLCSSLKKKSVFYACVYYLLNNMAGY